MPNTATDDHRYIIRAPWGDSAYADTREQAHAARQQLCRDAVEFGTAPGARIESVNIIDRGPAPQEA